MFIQITDGTNNILKEYQSKSKSFNNVVNHAIKSCIYVGFEAFAVYINGDLHYNTYTCGDNVSPTI